jgi:apolipoprotein N-acyltransferase
MHRALDSAHRSSGGAAAQGPRVRPLQWLRGITPGVVSGMLLCMSFPPLDWDWLAWFALVPLGTLLRRPWRSQPVYRPAWAGGLVFGLLAVHWIRYADDTTWSGYYGWLALGIYMSLYFPLFVFTTRIAVLRLAVPAIAAVPVIWVGLEYLRSWLITGFPWYFLGHTQHRRLALIQIADLAGTYGVSFLVALVNGWLVDVLAVPLLRPGPKGTRLTREQTWRLAVVSVALLAALGYGGVRLNHAPSGSGPRVALVQTNVPQKVKEDESQFEEIRRQYLELSGQLAARLSEVPSDKPRLVVWPETSYLFGIHGPAVDRFPLLEIDAATTDEHLRRLFPGEEVDAKKIRRVADRIRLDLAQQAIQTNEPVLMGLNIERFQRGQRSLYNSAVLITPEGELSPAYDKIHLVPWGEYLPLRDFLPWLHVFTPHSSASYGLEAGREPVRFRLDGYTFGVLICFEDTVPGAARAYLRGEPADFLVNISNDGWFGGSSELDAHLAISVFRAVECRRPLVRAVNTGISAIIDSSGRVVQVAGSKGGRRKLSAEVLAGDVPLDRRGSFYVRSGDWLAVAAFGLTILTLASGFWSAAARHKARAAGNT